jgi:hypothetical protein
LFETGRLINKELEAVKNKDCSLPLTLVNGKIQHHCGLQPNHSSDILAKAPCFSLIIPLTLVNGNDFYIIHK